MVRDYAFVSCDIVSHSAEASLRRQRDIVAAINQIVAKALQEPQGQEVIWASGGDGGHVAFPIPGALPAALTLILDLREWSIRASVNLRITANEGPAESIVGADGRVQLIGPGINLAGRIMPFGDQSRVIVTDGFARLVVGKEEEKEIYLHDERCLQPANFPDQKVYLLSVPGRFQSSWDTPVCPSDRGLLQKALAAGQPFEVIYRAKRLLDINPEDASAKDALHLLAVSRVRPQNAQSFIYDLLLDEQFGLEIVAASGLVERRRGETICEYNDRGTTMFVILKGQVGVFFPKSPQSTNLRAPPPDLIMSQGELAGELAFALRRPRTASLRCLEDSALLVIGSTELFFRIRRAKIGPQLEETLNRKLLQRIIENIWNTASCFRGGAAPSPLTELSTPWLTLANHAQLVTVSWSTRGINFADFERDLEGVCLLVSGRLRVEETTHILDGKDYPVVIANFPSDFVHRESKCLLLNDVRFVKIGQEGIQELGTEAIYPEIVKRIITSVSHNQERKAIATPKKDFDVFLSHNSKDKVAVRQLAEALHARGIMVWLDEWELVPGRSWQEALEEVIATTRSAAVLVGGDGFGPWEIREMRGCLSEFVNRGMPVIPVLLPTASDRPELPIFLKQFAWVDLRAGLSTEGLDRLVWGITGQKAKL